MMNRLPSRQELYGLIVGALELRGVTLDAEQRTELAGILETESIGIIKWIVRGMSVERRNAFLRRIRDAASRN